MEEQQLIAALKRGEANAFSQLVLRYQDLVYSTVLGFVQQEQDAEDVTQEAFVAVFQAIGDFRGDARLSTWLYRIAVSKALEWIRRKSRKKRWVFLEPADNRQELVVAPPFYHPGAQLERKEQAAILFAAIDRLPVQQKTAFLLAQAEQLSQQEIAAVMDTTVSSVESLLFRAKRKLRELLGDYYRDRHTTP